MSDQAEFLLGERPSAESSAARVRLLFDSLSLPPSKGAEPSANLPGKLSSEKKEPGTTPQSPSAPYEFERQNDVILKNPFSSRVQRPEVSVKAGQSIQSAIDHAPAGAIINVDAGIYHEKISINRDNITLKARGKAILDMGGRSVNGGVIEIDNHSNVDVSGFEICNVRGGETPVGIRVAGTGNGINISENNIHDIRNRNGDAHGIGVFGSESTPLSDVTISGNRVHDLELGSSEAVSINGNVDGFKVIGNTVKDVDNIGIDVIGYEGVAARGIDRARNGLVAGNTVENVDSINNPAYQGDRSAAGIYVDGGMKVTIENNTVKNANYGVELASEHKGRYTESVTLRKNKIENSLFAGISLGGGEETNGGVKNSLIEDNEVSANKRPIWYQYHVDRDTVIVRNNNGDSKH